MVVQCLEKAGLNSETTLEGLGMSLSGCEREETNRSLMDNMIQQYPNLSRNYDVCSDTVGMSFSFLKGSPVNKFCLPSPTF